MQSTVVMMTRVALCSRARARSRVILKNNQRPLLHKRYIPRSSSGDNDTDESKKKQDMNEQQPEGEPKNSNESSTVITQSTQLQLPNTIISRIRDTVFTFDTFFVTSVENYGENGVLFKGNLRGQPAATYTKLASRLQSELGTDYALYLLEDQEEKPVVVVIPTEYSQTRVNEIGELSLAILLSFTTIATTLNIMADTQLFNAALFTINPDINAIKSAVPGTLATLAILLSHEIGHVLGAGQARLEVGPPVFIPAGLGLLGSFGSITRIKGIVPNRQALCTVTAPGPLLGSATSLLLLGAGFLLTAAGGMGGIEVDSTSFRESLLVGGIAHAVFGDRIFTAASLNCNPLLLAGWSGLIINAINVIPAGELDGGRLVLGLLGRRSASRMSSISLFLLGVLGFGNSLSLFWLLLVLTLQRGPIVPCQEEVTGIEDETVKIASIVALVLPLLVLIPYPVTTGLEDLPPF